VEAPNEVPVHRREVYEAIKHGREATDIIKPKEPEVNNAVLKNTLDLQARITYLERENQQLKDRNKQLDEAANQEIQRRHTELVKLTHQLDAHKAHHLDETKGLNDRYTSLLSSHTKLQNTIDEREETIQKLHTDYRATIEETVQKLHTDYQITIANLHDTIDSLQNDASNTEKIMGHKIIVGLQDEIVDLTDCKEHLRRLGQELCGCDHVESPDERAQQTKHILETVRKLADNNLEYQQEITKIQDRLKDMGEPTILLCTKHQILHTCVRGCYLCDVEDKNVRAIKPTI
jgi:chromosome segregation ATPase